MGFRRRMGDCLATAARHIARHDLSTHLQLLNWDFVVSVCSWSCGDSHNGARSGLSHSNFAEL